MKQTISNQMSQTRGQLLRLGQDMGRAKRDVKGATRNRIIGGVMLLIGLLALIVTLLGGSQFFGVLATAGLFVGGLIFIRALAKMGGARRSMDTITDRVTNAQAKLTDLEAQPSSAE